MSRVNKTESVAVKSSSVLSDILKNLPLSYSNEVALLRLFADRKLGILDPKNHERFTFNSSIFTTADHVQKYSLASDALAQEYIDKILDMFTSRNASFEFLFNLKFTCPRALHGTINTRMGRQYVEKKRDFEKLNAGRPLGDTQDQIIRHQKKKLAEARSIMNKLKLDNGPKSIGTVFYTFRDFCWWNFKDFPSECADLLGYNAYALAPIVTDWIINSEIEAHFKVSRKIDGVTVTDFDRGHRLLTLFGLPGSPALRGDVVGLTFGLVTIFGPKHPRASWLNAPLEPSMVFNVKCICGEKIEKKYSFYDLARGRVLSCGCCSQHTITESWVAKKQKSARKRFAEKRANKSTDADFRFWSFDSFLEFVGLPYRDKLDLSRFNDHRDPDAEYSPGHAFWELEGPNRSRGAAARMMRKKVKSTEQVTEDFIAAKSQIRQSKSKLKEVVKTCKIDDELEIGEIPPTSLEIARKIRLFQEFRQSQRQ